MAQIYLMPKARNTVTQQVQKIQDLTGHHFTGQQRSLAEDRARQFAQDLINRTGDNWVGFVEEYTPTTRGQR
jgi:hypothetical protein